MRILSTLFLITSTLYAYENMQERIPPEVLENMPPEMAERFGVDIVIHPEKAACEEITRLVKHPYAVQVMDFESGRLTMLGLKIDSDCENIYDIPLGQLAKRNHHFRFGVIAILRGQETIVPTAEFIFQDGDTAYFVIKTEDIPNLMDLHQELGCQ